jgi:hypothetical protein
MSDVYRFPVGGMPSGTSNLVLAWLEEIKDFALSACSGKFKT